MDAESTTSGAARPSRARKKRKLDASTLGPDSEEHDLELSKKPQKKRRKQGRLAALIDMPIDVLFEIFGHLRPYDLLKLSRMTKEFRSMLMHKSSLSVWKAALAQVPDLPPCPPGMTEPQWVNLVFDPHCHFCLTPGVRIIEWRLRMRICAKCIKQHTREAFIIKSFPAELDDVEYFLPEKFIPTRAGKKHRRGYLISEYNRVKSEYEALEGPEARQAYIVERRRIMAEIEAHSDLCETWAQNQIEDRSLELQQLRDERFRAIVKELEALGWGQDIAGIRRPDSLADHELVRKPQRLTKRIWNRIQGPIIEFMENIRVKRLAREFAELVVERKSSAVKVLRAYKNARLPVTDVYPEGIDFCDFGPVKAVLESPADVTVDESSFSEVVPLIPQLIDEWRKSIDTLFMRKLRVEEARLRQIALLWGVLGSSYYDSEEEEYIRLPVTTMNDEETTAKMKLASAVFRCNSCRQFYDTSSDADEFDEQFDNVEPLFYPKVLGHLCLTRKAYPFWSWDPPPDSVRKLENYDKMRRAWSPQALRLDRTLGSYVETLVELAGLDPHTTTAEQMNELEVWFACRDCVAELEPEDDNSPAIAFAFGWRDALVHHAEMHSIVQPTWQLLDHEELEKCRQAYTAAGVSRERMVNPNLTAFLEELPELPDPSWACVHCRDLPGEIEPTELTDVKDHIEEEHGITDPQLNRDYYRDFAAQPPFDSPCQILLDAADDDEESNNGGMEERNGE
ncbi:hypothetical protein Hypma_016115 [Hypsizygus marmoreus]|uniref:F-box domain-containing protein n=1 Tax=Hypsizygus marmoreus TaxID=39966 RepID=A0A369KEL4_HYPMA|nr:hypothetical protein Hypma_016115 [Hypsizygus marmoreus]